MPGKTTIEPLRENPTIHLHVRDYHRIAKHLFPVIANAGTDVFNNDIQDVYVKITENVDEANEVLQKAFQFAQVSPYTVINMSSQTAVANAIIAGSRTLALIVSVLLLMVDFFGKPLTLNGQASGKMYWFF